MKIVILVAVFIPYLSIPSMATPDDTESMQRFLAAANLRRFPESLLHEALFPDRDSGEPVSREELQRLLETAEGQEAARSAALHAMLDEAPSRGGMERSGEVGWLGGMCDAIPWIAWLVECTNQAEETDSERESGTDSPYTLSLQHFEWATCPGYQ